jgi:1,4-dihydroxy-6-naphthoate synthase
MTQTIRVAHSPDSDDAFMFYALAEGKIDTGNLRYQHELSDIESLNRRALTGELEVTAVSIHAYAYLADRYALLNSGSSMGDGYGPRLVSATRRLSDTAARPEEVRGKRIAVPGKLTTAYLALKLFQPDFVEVVVPFDQAEACLRRGEVDLGLLIHEGQLTYQDEGFHLWADMGEWWFGETGLPLPLGGNVVRRDLGPTVIQQVARDLKASIVYALEHRAPALEHAKRFNRGIGDEKTDRFVGMYVNQWTVDYGERGRAAVRELLTRGHRAGVIPNEVIVEFVG